MINLRDFVLKALDNMLDCDEPEYKVRQCAAEWYEKKVLIEKDLNFIEEYYKYKKSGKEITSNITPRESIEGQAAQPVFASAV